MSMDVAFKDNVKERISQQAEKYKYVAFVSCAQFTLVFCASSVLAKLFPFR